VNARTEDVRDFWNGRAGLGQAAGSQDVLLKQLEMDTIAGYVRDGMRVVDAGCGNGVTAIDLATRHDIDLVGIDFAERMVEAATTMAGGAAGLRGRVRFDVADVNDLSRITERFDLAYTERTIINLPDWGAQRAAIGQIGSLLRPGGSYVMCEHSQDGLDELNALRMRVGLDAITPPWHNRYLRDAEIAAAEIPGLTLREVNHYSSTYYFLSRVANAWLAAREGRQPSYDAPLNHLGIALPSIGTHGQGRVWVWQKAS
jgi:SAM-dependent methyltransferase